MSVAVRIVNVIHPDGCRTNLPHYRGIMSMFGLGPRPEHVERWAESLVYWQESHSNMKLYMSE